MCILSPRDIMVVQEVFMTYFFLEKILIQSRFSDHVISIRDIICNCHFGLSLIQNPVFHDPASTALLVKREMDKKGAKNWQK